MDTKKFKCIIQWYHTSLRTSLFYCKLLSKYLHSIATHNNILISNVCTRYVKTLSNIKLSLKKNELCNDHK